VLDQPSVVTQRPGAEALAEIGVQIHRRPSYGPRSRARTTIRP
jgi:hypothetical protein